MPPTGVWDQLAQEADDTPRVSAKTPSPFSLHPLTRPTRVGGSTFFARQIFRRSQVFPQCFARWRSCFLPRETQQMSLHTEPHENYRLSISMSSPESKNGQ